MVFFDLEEREEKTVVDDADGFDLRPTARSCWSARTTTSAWST